MEENSLMIGPIKKSLFTRKKIPDLNTYNNSIIYKEEIIGRQRLIELILDEYPKNVSTKDFLYFLSNYLEKEQPFDIVKITFSNKYNRFLDDLFTIWLNNPTSIHPLVSRYIFPDPNPATETSFINMVQNHREGVIFTVTEQEKLKLYWTIKEWKYISIIELKRRNESYPTSYYSNLIHMEYQKSKRPITSMQMIQEEKEKRKLVRLISSSSSDEKKGNIIYVVDEKDKKYHAIAVSRYGKSKGGAYYGNPSKSKIYCGTFYFWEPNSDEYLLMGKSAYYINKLGAMLTLNKIEVDKINKEIIDKDKIKIEEILIEFTQDIYSLGFYDQSIRFEIRSTLVILKSIPRIEKEEDIKNFLNTLPNIRYPYLREYIIKNISLEIHLRDIMQIETEIITILKIEVEKFCLGETSNILLFDDMYILKKDENRFKAGTYIGWAFSTKEDPLDQVLCKKARRMGIDTVILAQMTSETRIVTEILDTRSREVSLDSLVWLIK